MEEIAISKFKATCLAVLEQVRKTQKPVRITKFGKPVADVVPTRDKELSGSWLGSMRGRGKVVGDIVSPAVDWQDWDALRE